MSTKLHQEKSSPNIYLQIDINGNAGINISYEASKSQLTITLQSTLSQIFNNNIVGLLYLLMNDQIFKISSPNQILSVEDGLEFMLILGNIRFFSGLISAGEITRIHSQDRKLCILETRLLGLSCNCNYVPNHLPTTAAINTDLHTHLSGQLNSIELIKIGLAHNILYPAIALEMLGINYDHTKLQSIPKRIFLPLAHLQQAQDTEMAIPIKELKQEDLIKISEYMHLRADRQSTFEDIELCYYLREPFTKNLSLLPDILQAIVEDYRSQNINYAELSTNAILDENWLEVASNHLAKIEKNNPVKLRFLAGLPRNLNESDLTARIEKIKQLAGHYLIAGVDVLGYEINKTSHLEIHLADLAKWVHTNRPDFIFRIHAGENCKNPTNVNDALFFALENKVRLRIGHAIYGINEETINIAKLLSSKNLLTMEFNIDSNIASNNIDQLSLIPIFRFMEAGIPCVLGSDGAGIYQTSAHQTAVAAQIYGLHIEHFYQINQTGLMHIKYQEKIRNHNNHPNTKSINLDDICDNDYTNIIKNMVPIMISGATGSSWIEIDKISQNNIIECFMALLLTLDAERVYFVTGRNKDSGAAIELGKAIAIHNFTYNVKFRYISMIVGNGEDSSYLMPKGLCMVKEINTPIVYLPSGTVKFIKSNNGVMIFIGGRSFTRDFIVEAERQEVDFLLMKGPSGASTEKSPHHPEKVFKDKQELISQLKNIRPDIMCESR